MLPARSHYISLFETVTRPKASSCEVVVIAVVVHVIPPLPWSPVATTRTTQHQHCERTLYDTLIRHASTSGSHHTWLGASTGRMAHHTVVGGMRGMIKMSASD